MAGGTDGLWGWGKRGMLGQLLEKVSAPEAKAPDIDFTQLP